MAAVNTSSDELGATARSAEPRLACDLIDDGDLDELLESVCNVGLGTKEKNETERLRTGVKSLDDALGGGVQSGRVVGVSGEVGAGASEFCCTLLVSSLLEYENSTAAIVDTTGNFDVLRLYTLIVAQISRRPGVTASLRSSFNLEPRTSMEDLAARILDRVKIMRVFDFVGVREAVGEIRDGIEKNKGAEPIPGTEEKKKSGWAEQTVEDELPTEKVKMKRTYVADSEDEEDDEEMLFDSEATITATAQPVLDAEPPPTETKTQTPETTFAEAERGQVKIILIDNLAQVVNPLLKKDYLQANTLAAAFLSTLTNLTQSHSLHTLLVNPALPPRASSPKRSAPPNQLGPLPQQQCREPPLPLSIFASNDVVPSLMHLLGRYTDVEVLVSRIPRRKMDARVYYSDPGGSGRKRGVDMVGVLEVVNDRWEGTSGAWGTFCEGKEGIRNV